LQGVQIIHFCACSSTQIEPSDSPKQISPKIFSKLKGHNGKAGATGATGPTGAKGEPGAKGETGSPGVSGAAGPGAATFTATLAESANGIVAKLANGVQLRGYCSAGSVGIELDTTSKAFTLELSGTASRGETEIFPININDTTSAILDLNTTEIDWDVIARDSAVGPFARIDAHGT
jgi:hypothetical protein